MGEVRSKDSIDSHGMLNTKTLKLVTEGVIIPQLGLRYYLACSLLRCISVVETEVVQHISNLSSTRVP